MTIEADIYAALKGLAAGSAWADFAKAGTPSPYIVYQQVGGTAVNFLEAEVAGKRNGRFQISCWADRDSGGRMKAAALSRQVEDTMVTTLKATVLGAPIAVHEKDTGLYGTMQDFSLWFTT